MILLVYLAVSVGPYGFGSLFSKASPVVLTAGPALNRPGTPSCKTIMLQNVTFAPSQNQPFLGNYAPPNACQPPWAEIILDWNGTVPAGQFDHVGAMWLGRTEIFRTITPELEGQRWHVEKNVSEYEPIMYGRQTIEAIVSVGSGKIIVNATLTFYETNNVFPPSAHPDSILPVSGSEDPPWFHIQNDLPSSSIIDPQSKIVRAHLEVYATAHSCEETWYRSNPFPDASCRTPDSKNSFREIQLLLDGKLVGIIWPFPYIYTGGRNPDLWEAIPPLKALDIQPYDADLTPFVGQLVDGRNHSISVRIVNNHGYWLVDGNLLLDLDNNDQVTSGNLTSYKIAPVASEQTFPVGFVSTHADRSFVFSGYVNTSRGQVKTTIEENMTFVDNLLLNIPGLSLTSELWTWIIVRTTTSSPDAIRIQLTTDTFFLGIRDGFLFTIGPTRPVTTLMIDQSMTHTGSVDVQGGAFSRSLVQDTLHAELEGTTSENYYSNSNGTCYTHFLASFQGRFISDAHGTTCA